MSAPLNIFIVSDATGATGATAEAVVTSSLVQFGGAESNVRRFPFVRTEEQVKAVLDQAPEHACIIVFTFVSRDLADTMIRLGVSRTGKTPTSIFLSCRKLKVANIPIVLDHPDAHAVAGWACIGKRARSVYCGQHDA